MMPSGVVLPAVFLLLLLLAVEGSSPNQPLGNTGAGRLSPALTCVLIDSLSFADLHYAVSDDHHIGRAGPLSVSDTESDVLDEFVSFYDDTTGVTYQISAYIDAAAEDFDSDSEHVVEIIFPETEPTSQPEIDPFDGLSALFELLTDMNTLYIA